MPITQFASEGNALLGIRDSGKSYSATYLAEQLYAANIPFVAFDPSGVWKFLRVPGKGAGLPIVVAGGKVPDLPLTPQSAPEIVRAAMRANVSLVLDLYDIHMSKADWGRIVESCVRVLLYENGEHGLRHVFIEEAAEFCPQVIGKGKEGVYAEVEKLARIGGNALLGYTLINQRAEQVNKAVLELCDCLFLHRQKGKNSLNSLSKWLEYSQGGDTKEIIKGLPTLPSGQCWVWPAGAEHATHVQMPQKNTFHPDRRALIANPAAANVQRIDATKFVSELKESLEKYLEEAKANDPAELKKRIRELEKQVARQEQVAPSSKDVIDAEQRGFERGRESIELAAAHNTRRAASFMRTAIGTLSKVADELDAETEEASAAAKQIDARPENPQRRVEPGVRAARLPKSTPTVARARQIDGRAPSRPNGAGADLGAAARKILAVLSQFPDGCTAGKLTLLTGYKYSGSFQNALSELRTAGLLVGANTEIMQITDAGLARGPFPELPTGRDLAAYWIAHPSFGKCAREVLRQLVDAPRGMTAQQLCDATGYGYSGSFQNALSELRTAGVLVGKNTEVMRASEDLF